MEGTPARGQNKWRNTWITEARDAQSFQSELIRSISNELAHEVVFGQVEPGSNIPQLPIWVKVHLERHPALLRKLEHGELVGISHIEKIPGPRPAAAARSSVLLFPVIGDGVLYGAIGLISLMEGQQLLNEDLEMIRQLAQQAGPVLGRILQLQRLSRENQELRRKNAEMKSLLQMRSHLQSNLAHELRTPLAAVRGYTRMILDGRAGQQNDTQREYLRIAGDNTTRLINLVNWMTHILEISSDNFQLTRFDLRDVWHECKTSEVTMKLNEVIPDEPFMVAGDRRKIARALAQLLGASQKLITSESNVSVQFLRGRDRETTVKVSDPGAVVPSELLTAIFDRSFSSVPMPLAQAEGSELGLSEIYDIIGMHGGRFFVNSKTGQGVTFLFTLPAVQLDGEEKLSHEQAVNSGR